MKKKKHLKYLKKAIQRFDKLDWYIREQEVLGNPYALTMLENKLKLETKLKEVQQTKK